MYLMKKKGLFFSFSILNSLGKEASLFHVSKLVSDMNVDFGQLYGLQKVSLHHGVKDLKVHYSSPSSLWLSDAV